MDIMITTPDTSSAGKRFEKSGISQIWFLLPVIAVCLGAILRVTLRSTTSLWEDEAIAATHAMQPALTLIVNVLVNDIHPPLYFLELHLWSAFGTSDIWLIANSVTLSLIALASMYVVASRLHGKSEAAIITAVFALLPVALWMSEEVRMYALLSVFFVWFYYVVTKVFGQNKPGLGRRLAIIALSVAIVYTHAVGLIAVFIFGLYAASLLALRRAALREWIAFFLIFGISGVCALPMLAADMLHKADMAEVQGFRDVLSWMASVVIGQGYVSLPWLKIAGILAYLAIVIAGVSMPRTKCLTWCFLVTPLVLCFVVGLSARPLFKTNFFSNFYSPFIALVLGQLIAAIPAGKTGRSIAFAGILALLVVLGVTNRQILNTASTYYSDGTALIMNQKEPGDVVWVPQTDIFWGMARYMVGPNWGSPLAIAVPPRPDSHWWRVYDALGPKLVQQLQLLPTGVSVNMADGTPLYISPNSQDKIEQFNRVWVVSYSPRDDISSALTADNINQLHRVKAAVFGPLHVELYQR